MHNTSETHMHANPATAKTTAPANHARNTLPCTGGPDTGHFPLRLLQSFDITMPDGREWRGSLLTSQTRSSGRRVQVHEVTGRLLFDSNDCFDQANAQNGLSLWLEEQVKQTEPPRKMQLADEERVG